MSSLIKLAILEWKMLHITNSLTPMLMSFCLIWIWPRNSIQYIIGCYGYVKHDKNFHFTWNFCRLQWKFYDKTYRSWRVPETEGSGKYTVVNTNISSIGIPLITIQYIYSIIEKDYLTYSNKRYFQAFINGKLKATAYMRACGSGMRMWINIINCFFS